MEVGNGDVDGCGSAPDSFHPGNERPYFIVQVIEATAEISFHTVVDTPHPDIEG